MEAAFAVAIPLAALIVSAATLLLAMFSMRQKAEQSYTEQLEQRLKDQKTEHAGRIVDLERRMLQCEQKREWLAEENVRLARTNAELMLKLLGMKVEEGKRT